MRHRCSSSCYLRINAFGQRPAASMSLAFHTLIVAAAVLPQLAPPLARANVVSPCHLRSIWMAHFFFFERAVSLSPGTSKFHASDLQIYLTLCSRVANRASVFGPLSDPGNPQPATAVSTYRLRYVIFRAHATAQPLDKGRAACSGVPKEARLLSTVFRGSPLNVAARLVPRKRVGEAVTETAQGHWQADRGTAPVSTLR